MTDLLANQYNNKKFSDVILLVTRMNDDKPVENKIYCNSMILSTYSGTFEEMFIDMEGISNKHELTEINMKELDVISLDIWLKYMYRDYESIDNINDKNRMLSLLTVYNHLNLKFPIVLETILIKLTEIQLNYQDIIFLINNNYHNNERVLKKIEYMIVSFINTLTVEKKSLTPDEELFLKSLNSTTIIDNFIKDRDSFTTIKKYIFIYYYWTVNLNEIQFLTLLEKLNIYTNIIKIQNKDYIRKTIKTINPNYSFFINMMWPLTYTSKPPTGKIMYRSSFVLLPSNHL